MGMKTGCNLYTIKVMKVTFFRNDVYSGGGRFGGTGSGGFSGGGGGQLDMHQLLGSLPVDSLPPFMQTLVSSLSHLTTQVRVWVHGYVNNAAV